MGSERVLIIVIDVVIKMIITMVIDMIIGVVIELSSTITSAQVRAPGGDQLRERLRHGYPGGLHQGTGDGTASPADL